VNKQKAAKDRRPAQWKPNQFPTAGNENKKGMHCACILEKKHPKKTHQQNPGKKKRIFVSKPLHGAHSLTFRADQRPRVFV